MIQATVVCDSIGPTENHTRLHTQHWRYPKFLHQESLRHRLLSIEDQLGHAPDFSFSVSSARAIPFARLLVEVRSDELRAAPSYWGEERRGMSPGGELPNGLPLSPRGLAKLTWKTAALAAADQAEKMAAIGVHKSIVNRIIEPYVHVNCLVTGTTWAWLNWFGLRLDGAADPTLQLLAQATWEAWNGSTPRVLQPGEWHLPYVDDQTIATIRSRWDNDPDVIMPAHVIEELRKISAARCARLSYQSFVTGKRSTIGEDLDLYQRLLNPGGPLHASPMEHQATPDVRIAIPEGPERWHLTWWKHDEWAYPGLGGNLGPGWVQHRKLLPGEAVAPLPEAYR